MKRKDSSDRRHSHFNSAAHQILTTPSSRARPSEDLKLQIEELIYELQQKDVTIASLQRNYEGVSSLVKGEGTWKDSVSALERENAALLSQLQRIESKVKAETDKLSYTLESKIKELTETQLKLKREKDEVSHMWVQLEKVRSLGAEKDGIIDNLTRQNTICLLYTSPSPRDS